MKLSLSGQFFLFEQVNLKIEQLNPKEIPRAAVSFITSGQVLHYEDLRSFVDLLSPLIL